MGLLGDYPWPSSASLPTLRLIHSTSKRQRHSITPCSIWTSRWIATLTGTGTNTPQLSIAVEGGSGTAVPNLSIEVDNLDEVLKRLERSGVSIEYGPVLESWGVRRFYVRDPLGGLLNILEHA
jgi:hypothetical protein